MKKLSFILTVLLGTQLFILSAAANDEYKTLQVKLVKQLKAKEYTDVLTTMNEIKSLGVKTPKSFVYFEGKALYESGRKVESYKKFESYIEANGENGRYYKQSTEYLGKAKEAFMLEEKKREEAIAFEEKEKAEAAALESATHYYNNGAKYVGDWKNGKRHGKGTYYWRSGDKYIGNYKNGKMHGKGTYYYSNGDKYVGDNLDK